MAPTDPPPRIPPVPPEERDDQTRELLAAATGSRDRELNIFSTLVRHPALFSAWLRFGSQLLVRGTLPGRDRELLILRTAWHCRADYEWGQHVPIARRAGLGDDEIRAVVAGPDAPGWSDHDAALLRAADELHRTARIADETWARLVERYDDAQMIELTMVVGQYHLVAFALNSCGVQREPGVDGLPR